MKAMVVKNHDGYYEMIGAAEAEEWGDVLEAADAAEKIEDLTGWGEYTEAWRVEVNGASLTYFVAA